MKCRHECKSELNVQLQAKMMKLACLVDVHVNKQQNKKIDTKQ